VNMGSRKLINLATPTSNADAATKLYVDGRSKELWYEIYNIASIGVGSWGSGQTNISIWQRREVTFSGVNQVNSFDVQIPIHTGKQGDTVANSAIVTFVPIKVFPTGRLIGYGNTGINYGFNTGSSHSTGDTCILWYYWQLTGNTLSLALYNVRAGNYNYLHFNNPAVYPPPAGYTSSSTPRYTQYGDWTPIGWTFNINGTTL